MPEWQIRPDEYLHRLNMGPDDFTRALHLPDIRMVHKVLPLRNIKSIESLVPVSTDMLSYLVRKIKTLDGRLPFSNARLKMVRIDPRHVLIGQKFVYRENYQKLLEEVPGIFRHFCVAPGGLADFGAYFVFGFDDGGTYSLSCYVPPLVERHGCGLIVMDGIHRNYIAKQTGTTPVAILIENVELPFPCGPREWSEIRVISLAEKPKDINERYFDLQQGLFRDLKYLGIDG